MKAILITTANRDAIAARFVVDKLDYDDVLPLGYYVVTDFGNDFYFDVLTKAVFNELFVKTGEIDNGWISIDRNY